MGKAIFLGIGISSEATMAEAITLIEGTLTENGLDRTELAGIATISTRHEHPVFHALADLLGVPAQYFNAAVLEALTQRLLNPSHAVFLRTGCHGVAEAAALAAAGTESVLLVGKTKSIHVTVALAG